MSIQSGFAITDVSVLSDAAEDLSTFLYAMQEHDNATWREQDSERIGQIDKILLESLPLQEMAQKICCSINEQYKSRTSIIYLTDGENSNLKPAGYSVDTSICQNVEIKNDCMEDKFILNTFYSSYKKPNTSGKYDINSGETTSNELVCNF